MIGLCTDSNALLPPELLARYGVEIVPLTVITHGDEYLEGVGMDIDELYRRCPDVPADCEVAVPSPGQFAVAYEELIRRGCTAILSVHAAQSLGTLANARLAARHTEVPVRLVDTGACFLSAACTVWATAESLRRGADLAAATYVAQTAGSAMSITYVAGPVDGHAARVIRIVGEHHDVVGTAASADDVVTALTGSVAEQRQPVRVGVGIGDPVSLDVRQQVISAIAALPQVAEAVGMRIAPSAVPPSGRHVVSCVAFPADGLGGEP
jgi:hypothetical protein